METIMDEEEGALFDPDDWEPANDNEGNPFGRGEGKSTDEEPAKAQSRLGKDAQYRKERD
jgi:hypothetical protein